MNTVNIVVTEADKPWIVGRIANELVDRLPRFGFLACINGRQGKFDIEYHANVYSAPKGTGRINLGLFAQEDHHTKWIPTFDGHVVLNPFMADLIVKQLMVERRPLDRINVVVIEQAVDDRFIRKTKSRIDHPATFGVAGSVKRDGRKGEVLVQKMLDAGYHVVGWGKGWPCPIVGDRYEELPAFYEALDYYVVTSTMEGGCTPIIECMAMGVPVISPRIGFAIRRPVLEYEKGSWESLERVLRYLTHHRTYEDWARDHAEFFRRFL